MVPAGVHPCSGLLTALSQLAIAQAQRGHDVELWLLGAPKAGVAEIFEEADGAGIERVPLRTSRIPGRLSGEAAREVSKRRVDIVHLHGVFSPHNNEVARRLRAPYVVSPHGGYAAEALEYHSLRKQVFARLFERPMLRRARVVCALTSAESNEVRRFGVAGPIAIVPNAVPTPPADLVDRNSLRATMGLTPETRVAVYAGRLDVRAKRLDDLVRGIAAAPEWNVHIIGGDYRNGARLLGGLIKRMRLENRVRLTGPKRGKALREELACADLFVLLSRSEGMPMALLEAASLGIPSLVSPEVERSSGVAAAGAGWLIELDQLTDAFQRLARVEHDEWGSCASAAIRYARGHDWSSVVATYESVYAGALSGQFG